MTAERVIHVRASFTTTASDDELIALANRWRCAEDGTPNAITTVEQAVSELFEFGVIYGQGHGNPTRAPEWTDEETEPVIIDSSVSIGSALNEDRLVPIPEPVMARAVRVLDTVGEFHGDHFQATCVAEDVLYAALGYEDGDRPGVTPEDDA